MAYEEIMTKPTLSSAISKTTSAISVTETNATMAMVAKISGKTVKDGTTLKSAAVESVVSYGKCFTYDERIENMGYNNGTLVTNTSAYAWAKQRVVPGVPCKIDGFSGNVRVTEWKDNTFHRTYLVGVATTKSFTPEGNYVALNADKNATASSCYAYAIKTTVLVPSEARNCVGYGLGISNSVCNIADFENGVYTQMVNEIDLKSLNWKYDTTYKYFYSDAISNIKKPNWDSEPSLICSKYTGKNWTAGIGKIDKTISINYTSGLIGITDLSYTDATAFKNALSDAKLVYELATPVVTPLKDYIRPLPVEQGGTLTLVNEHNLDVNSTIKYKKEV